VNIVGIDHIALRMADLDRAVGFYETILGMPIERRCDELGMVQLRAGTSLVDLVGKRQSADLRVGEAPHSMFRNLDHLCLRVADFDPETIRLTLENANVAVGSIAIRYGSSGNSPSLYLSDTEGNGLELRG
jgi:glyoxylase I family protein